MTWVQRLKCVFNIDVSICRKCGCEATVIASIEDRLSLTRFWIISRPEPGHPTDRRGRPGGNRLRQAELWAENSDGQDLSEMGDANNGAITYWQANTRDAAIRGVAIRGVGANAGKLSYIRLIIKYTCNASSNAAC